MNDAERQIFFKPVDKSVENFLTGVVCQLVAAWGDDYFEPERLDQIVAICNQPLIYRQLFAARLAGRPYSLDDARWFVSWSRQGWHEQTHFVFLIVDSAGSVIGAVDIKSADLASAEVGYWMSAEHGGVMTNAVLALCDIAAETGYRKLFGLVEEGNTKSAGVLTRAGFVYTGLHVVEGELFQRFVRPLFPEAPGSRTEIDSRG